MENKDLNTGAMSRFKQPKLLQNIALSRLGDWIAIQAENQLAPIGALSHRDIKKGQIALSEMVAVVQLYLLNNVPWMVYDDLMTETIRSLSDLVEKIKQSFGFRISMGKFVSQVNVTVSMLEALFTKHITFLSIDTIPKIMRSVFYSKLHLLKGLEYLNLGSLSGGWKTSDMEGAVIQSLKELHNLQYLFINYDCTDAILKCVVENCKSLRKLDVSCSKCVNDDSIYIIVQLKSLRSIQLYRTLVTYTGFAKLLINCNKIEDIGRCDEIGKVLEYIDTTNSEARPFHLKTFVSRYAPQHHLQLTVDMCPYIRCMTVFHNSLQGDLTVLIGLGDLCDLKLLSCDFYADQIKQLLQVKGCNLIHLHLEHVDQIDLNALMYISQLCPLLESLTLYNCTLIQHTSFYTKKLEILPFRNLKKITFVSSCTHEQLLFILGNCLNIEFIHIGTAVQLTDEFIANLIEKNPLIHLKELRIMQSDCLTIVSAQKIIESCMSLEVMVEMESWSLLTESDREHIKKYISLNNFNVDVQPIRRYDA